MSYRNPGVCLFVAIFCVTASLRAELRIQRVFGPEIPGGVYKHPASIEELGNGDLYIAYYGGEAEYTNDTAVFGSRRVAGSNCWTLPKKIADTPDRADGNGVIWQEPGGATWLFYVCRYGKTWVDSRIKYKYSNDYGHTWTDSEMLTFERGMMVRSQPIQLMDGDFLLPIYHETGNDLKSIGAQSASLFARYHKKTKEWSFTNKIHSRIGNLQPSVVQIDQNYLFAFCRRGGTYDPLPDGFIVRTESRDGGKTWGLGEDTIFPNPNSAIDLIKLSNGHLVMIYNDSKGGRRNPLTMRVSTDQGKTWPGVRNIVDTPDNEQGYPFIIQTSDGRIQGVYTSDKRSVVNHFVLSESDIQ